MTDDEFRSALNSALPRPHQAFSRSCAWKAREQSALARQMYGYGEPRSDEEIIEAAKKNAIQGENN